MTRSFDKNKKTNALSSLAISHKTSSESDNKIAKCAFSSCYLNFASSTLACLSLIIGSHTPCCFKNVYILIRHRLELFFRVNFSIIIWETIFYAIKTNQDWCCLSPNNFHYTPTSEKASTPMFLNLKIYEQCNLNEDFYRTPCERYFKTLPQRIFLCRARDPIFISNHPNKENWTKEN